MLFNRHKLDKAGEALIGADPFARKLALDDIQKWRDTHLFVMGKLNEQIKNLFIKYGVKYKFQSMRIKRMSSIEAKLRNNADKHMKLGGLQDIGGIRYVFENIDSLDKVKGILDEFKPIGFICKRRDDYIAEPKKSGYRGIHYVFQYNSEDKIYDKVSVELQIRTSIEHAWAMAVETASLISNTTLKAEIEDAEDWRSFFRMVSALFAQEEGKPIHNDFVGYSKSDFCKKYDEYKKKNLVDKLKALHVTTANVEFGGEERGFCVLTIDFVKHIVHAKIFGAKDSDLASITFRNIETTINKDEAALMVAIEKIKEIREAYPSYFLDAKAFLDYLDKFDEECKLI